MPDLEQLIADWRETTMAARQLDRETVDELETHLRESVEQLVRSGMTGTEAFQRAVAALGGTSGIASEFQKLEQRAWLPVKLVIALELMLAIAMVAFAIVQFQVGRIDGLLACHVFLITMGYATTFFIGGLGICFVASVALSIGRRLECAP